MPTYEWIHEECGARKDVVCSISDRNETQRCPRCDEDMERVVSVPYVTPESLWVESKIFPGQKVMVNDYDDPWEGTGVEDDLNAERSKQEMKGSSGRLYFT